jgi:hypothetical protein
MEKTSQESEPSSHQASLDMARSLLSEGASVEDVMAKSGLSKPACLGLKGSLVKASKRLKATSKPTEAETKPQIQIQAENKPQLEEDIPEPETQQIRSGSVLLEPGDVEAIRNMIPKSHQSTFIAHIDLASKRQNQAYRNDGHGSLHYEDAESELDREMARFVKAKRYQLIMNEGKTDTKHEGYGLKDVLSLAEFLGKRESSGVNPLEVYRLGRIDEGKVQAQVSNANNPTPKNEYDLKLESVRQEGQIENKKLEWEMQKYAEGKQDSREIYGVLKEVIKGPVENLTRSLGGAAADKIRGMGPKAPQIVDILCPGCGKMFKADGNSNVIICGHCGAQLQKQGSPPPQQPQPTQEPEPLAKPPEIETPETQKTETNQAVQGTPGA